jgi:hypothetical protein
LLSSRDGFLDICLHSEFDNHTESLAHIDKVIQRWDDLMADVSLDKYTGTWGRKWAAVAIRLPYAKSMTIEDLANEAAKTMKLLLDRTYPILLEMDQQHPEAA